MSIACRFDVHSTRVKDGIAGVFENSDIKVRFFVDDAGTVYTSTKSPVADSLLMEMIGWIRERILKEVK